jgi:hypothetical protein
VAKTLTPLDLTQTSIEAHWGHLQEALRGLPLPEARYVSVEPSWTIDLGTAVLVGPRSEITVRERGGRIRVHPLVISEDGASHWINWFERWDRVAGSRRPWRFRSSGITAFQGGVGVPDKMQLFRVEWPGFTSWQAGTVGWQAPGAGHPHWQFDALSDIEARFARVAAAAELATSLAGESELEEFGEEPLRGMVFSLPSRAWTRMHFASQARWSEIGWNGDLTARLVFIDETAGVSGKTVEKIAVVMKAAKSNPKEYGRLPEQMDKTGKVDKAWRQVTGRTNSDASIRLTPEQKLGALLDREDAAVLLMSALRKRPGLLNEIADDVARLKYVETSRPSAADDAHIAGPKGRRCRSCRTSCGAGRGRRPSCGEEGSRYPPLKVLWRHGACRLLSFHRSVGSNASWCAGCGHSPLPRLNCVSRNSI